MQCVLYCWLYWWCYSRMIVDWTLWTALASYCVYMRDYRVYLKHYSNTCLYYGVKYSLYSVIESPIVLHISTMGLYAIVPLFGKHMVLFKRVPALFRTSESLVPAAVKPSDIIRRFAQAIVKTIK